MNQTRATNKNSNSDSIATTCNTGKNIKKKYRCRECLKYFSSKQSLREHKYSHTNLKPYACNMCNKTFRFGSQLCIHRKTHSVSIEIEGLRLTDLKPNLSKEERPSVALIELVRLPKLGVEQAGILPNLFLSP